MQSGTKNEGTRIVYPSNQNQELLMQASLLIKQNAEMGLMLEQSVEALAAIASRGLLALVVDNQNKVVATAALTFEYPNGFIEFGGWAVAEEHMGKKLGKEILYDLLAEVTVPKGKAVIAFANSQSAAIFLKLGGKVMDQRKMHPDAFIPCATCHCKGKDNLRDGQKCVDKVIDLTPIVEKAKKGKK